MGKYIIKINVFYFEWSTIVDAPVTCAMDKIELETYIKDKYGREGLDTLPARLERVEKNGTSAHGLTLDELIKYNRAVTENNV